MGQKKHKILVTGGAGFVGSCLCRELKAQGHDVVALDDLSNGARENLPQSIPLLEADVSDPVLQERLVPYGFDVIIHCAAQASNALSFRDPFRDQKSNQEGTLNLLQFARKQGIRRFIFTSSMSVYGAPQQIPTSETTPCYPDSFYAVHKLASEHYVRVFAQEYGLDYTIFRFYTTYGRGQNLHNRDQGLMSIYLSYFLKNEPILVKGSKDRKRDIIHVDDVVEAIVSSIPQESSYSKVYNLGTGQAKSIEELLRILVASGGKDPKTYPIIYEKSTAGDPFETKADISAIERDLGWKPKISPEEGISLMFR